MNQIVTNAIVLRRTDYGEADRIVTLLTPDHGKLRLIAKGVRRVKSKLAGGIELFSVSRITFIKGRRDIGTMVSAQLSQHYGTIVTDINRTMLGYDLIKQLDRATEDETEAEYFQLMEEAFVALNNPDIAIDIIRLWFSMQLVRLAGHMPNLMTDTSGQKLVSDATYNFDADEMAFVVHAQGQFTPDHIKFLRLGFSGNQPYLLASIQNVQNLLRPLLNLVQTMHQTYIRI